MRLQTVRNRLQEATQRPREVVAVIGNKRVALTGV